MNINKRLPFAFAMTIFLSAFLLFLVQPLISKIILPWFGGSTGVWATCLVFFQSMLCLGYGYAHFLQRLPIRKQRYLHWGLLALGVVCLPVMPSNWWKPNDGNDPAQKIFIILLLKTGLPYLALSATGPLLQAWYARLYPDSRTYRLYALSNVASLSSLLLFPLWFERAMTSHGLSNVWSLLFVAFVACCGYVAYRASIAADPILKVSDSGAIVSASSIGDRPEGFQSESAPVPWDYFFWLSLPAFASFLLVAGTNHLCQDIASTPFLWIAPLCLYLISFILCFDAPRWYARRFYVVLGLIALYGVIAMRELDDSDKLNQGWLANAVVPIASPLLRLLDWYTPAEPSKSWADWLTGQVNRSTFHIDLIGQIGLHCIALFALFMVCHGELVRRKPPARFLTGFYLTISIGGALGSAFVSLAAPLIFQGLWEWLMGVAFSVFALCCLLLQWPSRLPKPHSDRWQYLFFVIPALLVSGLVFWQNSPLPIRVASLLQSTPSTSPSAQPSTEASSDEEEESERTSAVAEFAFSSAQVALGGIVVLLFIAVWGGFPLLWSRVQSRWTQGLAINAAAIVLIGFYWRDIYEFAPKELFEKRNEPDVFAATEEKVWRGRNFYGALTIELSEDPTFPDQDQRTLQHGRIIHGSQFLDQDRRKRPTTYYSKNSGVGIAIDHVSQRSTVRLGAIGLGTGTLAAYANPVWKTDDLASENATSARSETRLTIYEINPLVVDLSEKEDPWFTYVQDARARGAKVDIVLGDARLMMERESPRQFDVLAVDAFSGDSIPTHLLTDEAMAIYARHLKGDGVLAIHISNRYLDLEPVCKGLAEKYGYEARAVEDAGDSNEDAYTSTWVLLTKDIGLTGQLDDVYGTARPLNLKPSILWTDAYTSLYEVLFNSDYDHAVDVAASSHWFQRIKSNRPSVALKARHRWFRDGWTYLDTWPLLEQANENFELRVKDSKLESRSAKNDKNWEPVE